MKANFDHQNILITGVTGFYGQCLLQKILYSLSPSKIYVFIRDKKSSIDQRFTKILESPCFQRLRDLHKQNFFKFIHQKVQIMEADFSHENLSLSEKDKEQLLSNCNVIIHSAAITTFDTTFQLIFNSNCRGSIKLFQLAKQMKNLKHFCFISTLWANQNRQNIVQQKIYQTEKNSEIQYLQLLNMSPSAKQSNLKSIIEKFELHYAYLKNLTQRYLKKKRQDMSISIIRCPITLPAYEEPQAGYVTNITSLNGYFLYCGLGINHFFHGYEQKINQALPVDYVVNSILAIISYESQFQNLSVYHLSASDEFPISLKKMNRSILNFWAHNTSKKQISKPFMKYFEDVNEYKKAIQQYRKPILDKLRLGDFKNDFQKQQIEKLAISFKKADQFNKYLYVLYIPQKFQFKLENMKKLRNKLDNQFLMQFPIDCRKINIEQYLTIMNYGIHKFILKQESKMIYNHYLKQNQQKESQRQIMASL